MQILPSIQKNFTVNIKRPTVTPYPWASFEPYYTLSGRVLLGRFNSILFVFYCGETSQIVAICLELTPLAAVPLVPIFQGLYFTIRSFHLFVLWFFS